jgi:L-lactate dehydrogenase (cytochrome)/(S)-mandelate dehydrogenase
MVSHAWNIERLRDMARRRLPRVVFDFVDGGAEDEITLTRNRTGFAQFRIWPRPLACAVEPETRTQLFGDALAAPLIVAPTGLTGLIWPKGEVLLARAAAARGCIYTLSTAASCPVEEVAAAAPGRVWFQLYLLRDRGLTSELLRRARTAGCRVLVLTTDTPVLGRRERDLRNGFTIPPARNLQTTFDLLSHPRWLCRHRFRPDRVSFAHFIGRDDRRGVLELAAHVQSMFEPQLGWREVAWVREQWSGPMLLKGVLHPAEAEQAVALGIDGIIVSNHGGRQLDRAPGSIEALPAIARRLQGRVPLVLDGGVRRGIEILTALALGASACMIGRPALWGLACAGEAGAMHALALLEDELRRAMTLCGLQELAAIGRELLSPEAQSETSAAPNSPSRP